MIDLYKECSKVASQIPKGMVSTYGAIANALGDIKARRAVGVIMNTYGQRTPMPCHRVVYHDGSLGGFAYGPEPKIKRLAEEGVKVKNGMIVDFEKKYFDDFEVDDPRPLQLARSEQLRLARKVLLKDNKNMPDLVLGLDVAYKKRSAFGAGVLFSLSDKKVVDVLRTESEIIFPYVPTYLAFTEIPILKNIIEELDEPAILMHDGNGILHPNGIGIASHSGVHFGMPSIGVAKSLLCGEVYSPVKTGNASPVILNGKIMGYALLSTGRAKPVYVSPGHMISPALSLEIVRAVSKHKIPEPIRLAHIEAAKMRRTRS